MVVHRDVSGGAELVLGADVKAPPVVTKVSETSMLVGKRGLGGVQLQLGAAVGTPVKLEPATGMMTAAPN